jgi:signal transduction histidine kinase
MQAPQSSPAAKKHRPLESEAEAKSTGSSKSSGSPASFFAELSAAAAAANAAVAPVSRPVDEAEGRTFKATRPQPGAGSGPATEPSAAIKARIQAANEAEIPAKTSEFGKASRPRNRVAESADAPHRDAGPIAGAIVSPEPAKRLASVTDRRVESRRAGDGPASNHPAREWIRPDWMTHERRQEVQKVQEVQGRIQNHLDLQPGGSPLAPITDRTAGSPTAPGTRHPSAAGGGYSERGTGGAGLAHDASNLLAALMLYSELLSFPEVLPERYRHYADDLKLLAERSRTLIDRLVSFGGAVDRERTLDKGPVSLVDALMQCEGLLSTLTRGALQMTFGARAALPVAIAPESLERILVNLVKNAARATSNGGAVRIGVGVCATGEGKAADRASSAGTPLSLAPPRYRSAARQQGRGPGARASTRSEARRMMLTVDDSGCGMTEQQVARILNPNPEPAAEPLADPQRHGIGLRVVRELVAASGGKVAITSCVGVGTRIEIEWPVAEAETAERPEARSANANTGADAALNPKASFKTEAASSPDSRAAVPGTAPRMEMVADPVGGFAELARFEGGLSEAEQRLLTQQSSHPGKRAASCAAGERNGQFKGQFKGEFKGFNHDSKGAIAC